MQESYKILVKATLALRDGLKYGAEDFMLGIKKRESRSFAISSYWKKFEQNAYYTGYKIGFSEEFSELARKNKNLIKNAVDKNLIIPVDWYFVYNTNRFYIVQK